MPWASSCIAASTISCTDRLWPRWITSAPWLCMMRRITLMDASWPSNRLVAVTKRSGVRGSAVVMSFPGGIPGGFAIAVHSTPISAQNQAGRPAWSSAMIASSSPMRSLPHTISSL